MARSQQRERERESVSVSVNMWLVLTAFNFSCISQLRGTPLQSGDHVSFTRLEHRQILHHGARHDR